MKKLIDLHVHTTSSDGTCSPEEILKQAEEKGIYAISFTDHDTLHAYEKSYETPLKILPGIEISTLFQGYNVHLLAYGFSPQNALLLSYCIKMQEKRQERAMAIGALLKKEGIAIEDEIREEMHLHKAIGRPHIAALLIQKGFVKTMKEAFSRYLGGKALCYVSIDKLPLEEALLMVRKAGGKAVLAHPHLLPSKLDREELLIRPFDGIECFYGNFPEKNCLPWLKACEKKGLLPTGGSDFHGSCRPFAPLGISSTPEKSFEMLWKHYYGEHYCGQV